MSQESATEQEGASDENDAPPPAGSGASRRPSKILPSPRLAVPKQLDAIRAFALASKVDDGLVTNEQAGKIIDMSPNTIVVCNAFFCDVGILQRKDSGKFEVSDVARAFSDAYEWNPETAGAKLAPVFEDKWFAKSLIPRLKMRDWSRADAVQTLAESAGASKEYRANVEMLIDFMAFAQLIKADGNVIKAVASSPGAQPSDPVNAALQSAPIEPLSSEGDVCWLNKERTRKVLMVAPHDITPTEVARLKQWIDLWYFVEDASAPALSPPT